MKFTARSHLGSAIVGGLIVAGGLLAFGATGQRTVQTIVEESPGTPVRATGGLSPLTPRAIYQREAPAVVFVSAPLIEPEASPFDVLHQAETGIMTGSGFLVDHHGDVVTAYHLIAGASRAKGVSVRFEGGIQRWASVVGEDPGHDVAVLRVDMHGVPRVPPLPMGDSSSVRIGDPTLALGNPYGLDRTLSSGIVSALAHQLVSPDGVSVDNVIQTEEPLDPAASGGPLLDGAGRVIGVQSQLAGPEGAPMAFATPIDTVVPMLHSVQLGHRVAPAYLGLSGVATRGTHPAVTITSVARGGPAARAGLRRGDAIVRLGVETISSLAELDRVVAATNPGQGLPIEISRNGRIRTIVVRLGARR